VGGEGDRRALDEQRLSEPLDLGRGVGHHGRPASTSRSWLPVHASQQFRPRSQAFDLHPAALASQ